MSKPQTSVTSLDEEVAVAFNDVVGRNQKEGEAVLSALTLSITDDGQLVVDRDRVDVDALKDMLDAAYPNWADLDVCIDCIRWVNERLDELHHHINMEYEDESVHI